MKPDFIVKIPGYRLEQTVVLPEEYQDYYLPGSEISAASGDFGKISVQKISLDEYHIYYATLTIEQDLCIHLYYSQSICISQVILQGAYEAVIQGIDKVAFKQHTFSLLYHNQWNASCYFSKGCRYIILAMCYPAKILQPVLAFYPRLEALQNCIEKSSPVFLQQTAHSFSAGFSDLIYQLLQVPFISSTKRFHLDNLQAIIIEMCKQLNSVHIADSFFSLNDIAIIYTVKNFIDTHLDKHYTISQLARKAGINEQKLKKGFKNITGFGVFGYLLRQRLIIAKVQLEQTNKTIPEIARKAGYNSNANFCSAFKRLYGISPYQLKRENKKL